MVFLGLRSAVHLLGDGQLHLHDLHQIGARDLRFSDVGWANNNAPLSNWLLYVLHRLGRLGDDPASPLWSSPVVTFRVYSVASGVLYVLLSVATARRFGRAGAERGLLTGFLLTAGYLQLFAGYAEMYALLPIPYHLALSWFLSGLAFCMVAGIVVAGIYKPAE